mmetsp:Transcript_51549/g.144015  ORF Transcript_51549/g.144015 Transcript_51549/m.144015 type:complete len:186 (+) Transcript_51549:119-676(+)
MVGAGRRRGADADGDLLAETRRRSSSINFLVDMIPARFYLTGDFDKLLKSSTTLDPARTKSTSQLVEEAAVAAGGVGSSVSSTGGAFGNKNLTRKKKEKNGTGGGGERAPADARSRLELREKLERRILELREERRQRQSAADKAKAAEVRAKREAAGTLEQNPRKRVQIPQGQAKKNERCRGNER